MKTIALDDLTIALAIKVPGSRVAFLQSLFESYEGVGSVRTIDIQRGEVIIMTTPDQLAECKQILEDEKEQLKWSANSQLNKKELQKIFDW